VHERFSVDRNPHMRRAWVRRVEEDEIAGPDLTPSHRLPDLELFHDRSRHIQSGEAEHVPHEAAAVEPRHGDLASQPVGRPAQRKGVLDHAPRNYHVEPRA
jgi:hypothetical protein